MKAKKLSRCKLYQKGCTTISRFSQKSLNYFCYFCFKIGFVIWTTGIKFSKCFVFKPRTVSSFQTFTLSPVKGLKKTYMNR